MTAPNGHSHHLRAEMPRSEGDAKRVVLEFAQRCGWVAVADAMVMAMPAILAAEALADGRLESPETERTLKALQRGIAAVELKLQSVKPKDRPLIVPHE